MITKALFALLVLIAGLVGTRDLDGHECYEDEAVVMVISTWGTDSHNVAVTELACVPVDEVRFIR